MDINLLREAWDKVQFDCVCKNKSTSCMSYGCKECLNNIIKKALDKQIPKKPIDIFTSNNVYTRTVCGCCEHIFGINKEYDYCPYCGQAIDWSK